MWVGGHTDMMFMAFPRLPMSLAIHPSAWDPGRIKLAVKDKEMRIE